MIIDIIIWFLFFLLLLGVFLYKYRSTQSFSETSQWFLWDFTGFRYVTYKIYPPNNDIIQKQRPSTFILWLLTIYAALFGIAGNRYEASLSRMELRANTLIAQLISPDVEMRRISFKQIADIQNIAIPIEPKLFKPSSVIGSFVVEKPNDSIGQLLLRVVENSKTDLRWVSLGGANLQRASLISGKFRGAYLVGSDFSYSDLRNSDFHYAMMNDVILTGANLSDANFKDTSLRNANLMSSNLLGAYFENANLSGANLKGIKNISAEKICISESLVDVKFDEDFLSTIKRKCPDKLNRR